MVAEAVGSEATIRLLVRVSAASPSDGLATIKRFPGHAAPFDAYPPGTNLKAGLRPSTQIQQPVGDVSVQKDLPRVEDPAWVQRLLHRAHHRKRLRTVFLLEELALADANAVLATARTPE